MFWGWFSSGDGGMRHGGGCIFLPFLFICGSFFLFDNFNSGWLLGLILVAVMWFVFSTVFGRVGAAQVEDGSWEGGVFDGEKPKRDFADEKPKRSGEYIERHDGEILEVIEPSEEEDSRPRDEL